MKPFHLLSFLTAMLLGCTASLHPIVDEKNIYYVNTLPGDWVSEGMDVKVEPYLQSKLRSIPFGEKDSLLNPVTEEQKRAKIFFGKSYIFSYTEKQNLYVYEARLTKIGGYLFAEVYPYKSDDGDEQFMNHEGAYALAKVEFSQRKIMLSFLDGDKIRELALSGNIKIRYQHEQLFDSFVITAKPSELRGFLEKYAEDQRLFNKKNVITLTRK